MTEEKETTPCDAYGDADGRSLAIWVLGEQGNFTETLLPYLLVPPCQFDNTARRGKFGPYHQQRVFDIPENWDPYSYCISYLGMDPLLIVTDLYDVEPKRIHGGGFVLLDPLQRKAVWHYWCNPKGVFGEAYLVHNLPFHMTNDSPSRPHFPGTLGLPYAYSLARPESAVNDVWLAPWWSALQNNQRSRIVTNATNMVWVPILNLEKSLAVAIERAEDFRKITLQMETAPSEQLHGLRSLQYGAVEIYELPEWWYVLIRDHALSLMEIPARLMGMILLFPTLVLTPDGCIRLSEQPNITKHLVELTKQKKYAEMEALYDLMHTKIVEYLGSMGDRADWYLAEFSANLAKPSHYLPEQALGYKKPEPD